MASRLPHPPLALRRSPVLLVLAAVSIATAVLVPATAAGRTPSYSTAFKKLDRQWRVFLNNQKVLASETQVAKQLCEQAQQVESDPSTAQYAPLMWNELDSLLSTAAVPVLDDTRDARHDAMVKLESLDSTFSKLWARKPAKRRVLRRGVQAVLHADDLYLAGLDEVKTALVRWSTHLCASAQAHVDTANKLMPRGDDALNDGMGRLRSLL